MKGLIFWRMCPRTGERGGGSGRMEEDEVEASDAGKVSCLGGQRGFG